MYEINSSSKKQMKDESVSATAEKTLAQKTGCKGTYSFSRLRNHNCVLSMPPEPMHLFKNIA